MSVRPIEYSVCLVKEISGPFKQTYNVIDKKSQKAEPKIP
jgi:hypothetical protein